MGRRGLAGYDDSRPEERLPNHHSLLLKLDGRAIGTTRLDETGDDTGIVRLVAVPKVERGNGHGRVLSTMVEDYAYHLGIRTLFVSAAREALGFYVATGWRLWPPSSRQAERTDEPFVTMTKVMVR